MAYVLILDDDYHIRLSVRKILENVGYEIDEAIDGQEGIDKYRERPADLSVLDIMLPRKNGLEVI